MAGFYLASFSPVVPLQVRVRRGHEMDADLLHLLDEAAIWQARRFADVAYRCPKHNKAVGVPSPTRAGMPWTSAVWIPIPVS
ncbi:MAG: hypothetical protein ACLR7Z_12455 [Bilophila wadsworthia]